MTFQLRARGTGDCKTRYRPQRLDEIVPTFPLKEARAILGNPNASQVWLFEGLTGCGKTTLARIIARACICEASADVSKPCLECKACQSMERAMDFTEINVAEFGGKEAVKKKISDMCYKPGDLKRKVFIFDEAHQMTPAAQELMNKVLEEPIGDTLIFLCTTRKKGLKRTLLGRCQKINFRRLTMTQMKQVAAQICEDEEKDPPSDKLMEILFRRADGSVRDFLNDMDKYLIGSFEEDEVEGEAEQVREGSPDMFAMVDALKIKDWPTLRDYLMTDNVKNEPEGYRQTLCDFLRRQALKSEVIDLTIAGALGQLSGSLDAEPRNEQYNILVLRCMRACFRKK